MEITKSGYIAIIGKPNVGKSTLLNSILGTKLSIVTPKAQTTRKKVLGIYSDSYKQMIFLDTPGIIKPDYEMQNVMMSYVDSSLDEADVVVYMTDLSKYKESNELIPAEIKKLLNKSIKPKILILNKSDLIPDKKAILPIISRFQKIGFFQAIMPISSLDNSDARRVVEELTKYLPEGPFYYDPELISTQPERFFISEIIREKIFEIYSDEIPYSTEVTIADYKERENGKWYISAEIIVERPSQKAIIIGEGGRKIKQTGKSARIDIEEHLGIPVYLELFVKVREKWRSNINLLRSYGY
jgi:GTP-binding protein Era